MKNRIAIAALSLSAVGFIGIISSEGYSAVAYVPIANDRPTLGFGSTFHENGAPVKIGDTTTPQKAMRKSLLHIGKDELNLRRCVTGNLSQQEYDILIDFAYWRGSGGACRSEVVANINKGDYVSACEAYLALDSRRAAKNDCAIRSNNCRGVWIRAQERYAKCMAAQ